jgi:hypothetical protein
MRTAGSARFEPYFKAQWFDSISLAWKDVQRAHPTEAEARATFTPDKQWRVMRITPTGRHPLPN